MFRYNWFFCRLNDFVLYLTAYWPGVLCNLLVNFFSTFLVPKRVIIIHGFLLFAYAKNFC